MKSITKQKTFEEIEQQLDGFDRVYITGCGTCTTMTKTGGREEVLEMRERLQELGKLVTGWTERGHRHRQISPGRYLTGRDV